MSRFALLQPGMLWLGLALLPLALWLFRRRAAAAAFAPALFLRQSPPANAGAPPVAPLPDTPRQRLLWLPPALTGLGLAALVVALARPIERVPVPQRSLGIDIVLCLDRSSSMAATDMDGDRTRLEVSVDAARRFIADRTRDRIALLGFAAYADVLCPLTLDHDTAAALLDEMAVAEADSAEDLTGIGNAVARAAVALRDSRAASKVVILLTDGEENVATAQTPDEIGPAQAAVLCGELGVAVYSIAVGTGQRTADGALAPLDTAQIERLAADTGGRFYRARDAAAIAAVYEAIDALEVAPLEQPRFDAVERFAPLLALGLGALLLARLLAATHLEVLP